MFFPFQSLAMLAVESSSVITKRLDKIGRGGEESLLEIQLMFAEKADAMVEAGVTLMTGGTPATVVAQMRGHVAENEARLSK